MTLGEKMDRRYEDGWKDGEIKGRADGEATGEARINKLYQKLRASDRLNDFAKAMDDPDYQAKLLEEFGLRKIRYQ